jgi:hypothetical protein
MLLKRWQMQQISFGSKMKQRIANFGFRSLSSSVANFGGHLQGWVCRF